MWGRGAEADVGHVICPNRHFRKFGGWGGEWVSGRVALKNCIAQSGNARIGSFSFICSLMGKAECFEVLSSATGKFIWQIHVRTLIRSGAGSWTRESC